MGNFTGGSAYAMVQQVADGFLLVTERSFRRLGRGEQPDREDLQAVQQRNRKIQRLNTCRMMLRTYRQRRRT